jgi:AmmeMemoRadiSam system protein A
MATVAYLSQADKIFMLRLARETLARVLDGRQLPEPREVSPALAERGACFLTITRNGALRGCIGNVVALEPLYEAVMHNAREAAQHDSRFSPLQPNELEQVKIEITVLSKLEDLTYTSPEELLNQLQVGEHGVVLHIGCRVATFLPQMWKTIPDKADFLDRLSEKAGCSASAWRYEETGVAVFHGQFFAEDLSTH